jgi:hypothetical protein
MLKWQENLNQNTFSSGNEIQIEKELTKSEFDDIKRALKPFRAKWRGGKSQSFLLALDAKVCVDYLLTLTDFPNTNPYSYHPTPEEINYDIFTNTSADPEFWRHLDRPIEILEPSAGEGSLCDSIKAAFDKAGVSYNLTTIELDEINCITLKEKGFNPINANFLEYVNDKPFDLVVMNPPFEGLNFIKHIRHAQKMLNNNGKLVSVVPSKPLVRTGSYSLSKTVSEFVNEIALTLDDPFDFAAGVFETAKKTETRIIELYSEKRLKEIVNPDLEKYTKYNFSITYKNDGDIAKQLERIDITQPKRDAFRQIVDVLTPVQDTFRENNHYLPDELFFDFCEDVYVDLLENPNIDEYVSDVESPSQKSESHIVIDKNVEVVDSNTIQTITPFSLVF